MDPKVYPVTHLIVGRIVIYDQREIVYTRPQPYGEITEVSGRENHLGKRIFRGRQVACRGR
jgi:hypothetical protein